MEQDSIDIIETFLNGNLTAAAEALERGGAALTARTLVYGIAEKLLTGKDAMSLTDLLSRRAAE